MKLLYHKGETPNFGDDLNAEIWSAIAPALARRKSSGHGFLGIGTIIGKAFERVRHLHVFGSGAGYDPIRFNADNVSVWCVRGPLTARALGLDEAAALTDGAILSPFVYPKAKPHGKTILIPHWQSINGNERAWRKACQLAGVHLVSPMGRPADVIREISGASLVLTESLHGAILADTYDVPWSAWTCSGNISLFKWVDWTASMKLPFELNFITPPTLKIPKRLGKPIGQTGTARMIGEEDLFTVPDQANETEAPGWKERLKTVGKSLAKAMLFDTPFTNKMLQTTPNLTAEHIRGLLEQPTYLSKPALRRRLQGDMLDRFKACLEKGGIDSSMDIGDTPVRNVDLTESPVPASRKPRSRRKTQDISPFKVRTYQNLPSPLLEQEDRPVKVDA